MTYQQATADILDWCRDYDGPPFHAILCDAPYEIAFMGKGWDAQGVSFRPDTWAAIAEHLLPGALLFVFADAGGTIEEILESGKKCDASERQKRANGQLPLPLFEGLVL